MHSLDLDRVRTVVRGRLDDFARAAPFPHVVIDDFLPREVVTAVADEFATTAGDWIFYHHVNERKRGFRDVAHMGPATGALVAALNAPPFVALLGELAGGAALLADPTLEGGGLGEVPAGGWVNVHADFLSHPRARTWRRRLNLIVFLNDGWSETEGGALELWDADVTTPVHRIVPVLNRCVIFATTPTSFHAVAPVHGAPGRARRSLALYYYADEGVPQPIRSTHYMPRPDDPMVRRMLIHLDRLLLHAYALVKRYTPLGDRLASRLLRRL